MDLVKRLCRCSDTMRSHTTHYSNLSGSFIGGCPILACCFCSLEPGLPTNLAKLMVGGVRVRRSRDHAGPCRSDQVPQYSSALVSQVTWTILAMDVGHVLCNMVLTDDEGVVGILGAFRGPATPHAATSQWRLVAVPGSARRAWYQERRRALKTRGVPRYCHR